MDEALEAFYPPCLSRADFACDADEVSWPNQLWGNTCCLIFYSVVVVYFSHNHLFLLFVECIFVQTIVSLAGRVCANIYVHMKSEERSGCQRLVLTMLGDVLFCIVFF